jgi:mono/diheme cytochrome c family protein
MEPLGAEGGQGDELGASTSDSLATSGAGGAANGKPPPVTIGVSGSESGPPPQASVDQPPSSCEGVKIECRSPVETSEPLPGRVLPAVQTNVTETVSLQRIFESFDAACGRCHAPPEVPDESNGNWVVAGANGLLDDDEALWREAIERIETPDPDLAMPPTRDPSRPLTSGQRELLDNLTTWLDEARRSESGFVREVTRSAETPYRYDDEFRQAMTNIGNCVPEPEFVGCAKSEMQRLDDLFARIESFSDLPKHLEETDLFTLDTVRLAEQRVISYAPSYTLFSDNAKKMRYVRVPEGQVIRYDGAKDDFEIPENTRFYKTFLRRVVDSTGEVRYRKIETRIIISRPDVQESGVATPGAIFGTYLWSLDEAHADLVELPYNDQTPFRDLPLRHVTDEVRALANPDAPIDPNSADGIVAAFEHDEALRQAEPFARLDDTRLLTRGYALPGRDRCVQCHMGSSSHSFILGFNQYQADRRAGGEGGVFDAPVGLHELSQLSRLIEYGVVVDDTLPTGEHGTRHFLESSQGERTPRNEFELGAQGYMMGNCAFCHNPSGFPTVENPVLRDVLNFYPRRDQGGIFRFPLDTFSPRTSRTPAFNVRFPYITPSLFERNRGGNDDFGVLGVPPKNFPLEGQPVYVAAPWRALLYRNVQTPFTYAHDEAIHPHMPLNVPGFDPRAPRIMGDWMLSIPARLAEGAENSPDYGVGGHDQPWVEVLESDEHYVEYAAAAQLRREAFHSARVWPVDEFNASCQKQAGNVLRDCVADESAGVTGYFGGAMLQPDTSDVFAAEMRGAVPLDSPLDSPFLIVPRGAEPAFLTQDPRDPALDGGDLLRAARWLDGIPDRPHWVARDLTSIPGKWAPRGSRWEEALADVEEFVPPPQDLSNLGGEDRIREQARQETVRANALRVFHLLQDFELSEELATFALSEQPYGLWHEPANGQTALGAQARCAELIPSAPTVADLRTDPPRWLAESGLDPAVPSDAARRVYTQPPGETMFTLICSNCHGKLANAESLLANTILELTGGDTRVANLRDGIFGAEGQNRADVFPSEDTAVRYLLWMGLGGTQATIPRVVLNRVGATRPLGVDRGENPNAQATANMLDNAVGFCKDSLGIRRTSSTANETAKYGLGFDHFRLGPGAPEYDKSGEGRRWTESSLVASNGDAELWIRLCSMDNPGPIRAIEFHYRATLQRPRDGEPQFAVASAYWRDLDGRSVLPEDVRLGDQHGRIRVGQSAWDVSNTLPWCILEPTAEDEQNGVGREELLDVWHGYAGRENETPPWCPEELFVGRNVGLELLEVAPLDTTDERRDRWATRGAMNIGASVFVYLDALSKGRVEPKPAHDACALGGALR